MNMYMNYGRDGLADCCVVLYFEEIKTLVVVVVVVVVHMPSDNLWLDKNRKTKTIG